MSDAKPLLVTGDTPLTLTLVPQISIEEAKRRMADLKRFVREYLVRDEDYGRIPGTKRDSLWKSGAEKMCDVFSLADSYKILSCVEDYDRVEFLFDYTIECTLTLRGTGKVIATGLGSCNSYEGKYRWREGLRFCPSCHKPAIRHGKEDYGGGWYCARKDDGCGKKFKTGDPEIEGQKVNQVPNDDMAAIKNTILKMAAKRAKVGAVIAATRSSGLLTQDTEVVGSMAEDEEGKKKARKEKPAEKPAEQKPATESVLGPTISRAQQAEIFEQARKHHLTNAELAQLLGNHGYEQTAEIPLKLFAELMQEIAQYKSPLPSQRNLV